MSMQWFCLGTAMKKETRYKKTLSKPLNSSNERQTMGTQRQWLNAVIISWMKRGFHRNKRKHWNGIGEQQIWGALTQRPNCFQAPSKEIRWFKTKRKALNGINKLLIWETQVERINSRSQFFMSHPLKMMPLHKWIHKTHHRKNLWSSGNNILWSAWEWQENADFQA